MPSLLGERGRFLAMVRISWWAFRARTTWRAGDHLRAEELYARCAALADAIGEERVQAESLVDRAGVLYELGRIKEAMAVSAPLLPGGTIRAGSDLTCQALALWIDGALDLAVSAPAIERVLTMLENHVDSASGFSSSRASSTWPSRTPRRAGRCGVTGPTCWCPTSPTWRET